MKIHYSLWHYLFVAIIIAGFHNSENKEFPKNIQIFNDSISR